MLSWYKSYYVSLFSHALMGIVIKVGDRTHPDSVEIIASFSDAMDCALDKIELLQRNELKNSEALVKITGILSNFFDIDSIKKTNRSGDSTDEGCAYVA